MAMASAAADIVVSRAGAMSVAELCVAKKPVVFVPYPYAAEDHQTINAQYLVNKDAALMVKDANAAEQLVPTIISLLTNEIMQEKFTQNIAGLAQLHAAETIAEKILDTIQ
jgi:UDP-N-acetylglucosamine--N-acetylmuramyl-(pentapeptide) pyrophosphoryl-undecaprenol N-acetylglucosamine transferase